MCTPDCLGAHFCTPDCLGAHFCTPNSWELRCAHQTACARRCAHHTPSGQSSAREGAFRAPQQGLGSTFRHTSKRTKSFRTHTTVCKTRAPVSPPARIIYHRPLCQTSATRRAPFSGYTVLPDSDLWKYWNAAPTRWRFLVLAQRSGGD